MDAKKLAFSDEVLHLIRQLCNMIFNVVSKEQMESLFNMTSEQLKIVIRKLISVLPDVYFDKNFHGKLEILKTVMAREFIFFQIQEKWMDPNYQHNLANFIRIFLRDIEREL